MLDEIKKIQGITNSEFDTIIKGFIESGKADLKAVGVKDYKVNSDLLNTAIITYVLSFLDVNNSEMYSNSYALQKDVLRHLG